MTAATGAADDAAGDLVRARGLRKSYGRHDAVSGVDLAVRRGQSVGLLGPNGAGKSSLMRVICCVSPPSGGELRVLGLDPRAAGPRIRRRLGVVPQYDSLDTELTPYQNLYAYGRYFGLSRSQARAKTDELLGFARLADRADAALDTLSGGMRRQLAIARSLVNSPELLLMDEPTTSLDPQARQIVWQQLRQLKQAGVALIVTSHHMDEVEELCDRVLILDHGRIVAEGTPAGLIRRHAAPEVVEIRMSGTRTERARAGAEVARIISRTEQLADRTLLYVDDGERAVGTLRDHDIYPHSILVRSGSLEDVLLRLTGRGPLS